jgi:hypothetical protein
VELKGKKPADEGSLPGYASNLIIQGLKDAGLNDKHPQTSGNTEAGRAYTQTEEALQSVRQSWKQAHKGAEPPPEVMKQAVASELVKVKVQQPFYRPDTTVTKAEYEANPDYRGRSLVPSSDVPKDWDAVISARAPNATPAQKRAIYQSMLRQSQSANGVAAPPSAPAASSTATSATTTPKGDVPDFKAAISTGAKLRPPPTKASLVHPVNAAILSGRTPIDTDIKL